MPEPTKGRKVMLGYESLTLKGLLELDSAEFGESLRKVAALSQDAIKSEQKVYPYKALLNIDSCSV